LNTARFIAKRIARQNDNAQMSKPIVKIAMAGVALGIAVMILAIGIVKGFQKEVRELVVGFGSHIQVVKNSDNYGKDSEKIEIDQNFYPSIADSAGFKHIQIFATKAGILETPEQIQGVVIKGIADDFNWEFFQSKIIKGSAFEVAENRRSSDLLISSYMANRLELDTGSQVTLYFVQGKEDISPRNFKVSGIYRTGLQDFDKKFVFVDIGHIQKLSNWGIEAQLLVDSCRNGQLEIEAIGFGGVKPYSFEWTDYSWKGAGPHQLCVSGDSLISVIISDSDNTIADTAFLSIQASAPGSDCSCNGFSKKVTTSGGSWKYYTGGFEIMLNDYNDLFSIDDDLMYSIPFYLKTVSIVDQSPEIFSWLEVLDLNVIIIIILMILVSVINMASALLILILERTSMIGVLKAFGFQNSGVVSIFLYQAAWIIGRGMLIGNLVAIGLGLLQIKFGFFKLNPEHYYLSEVPVLFTWQDILLLNAGTLILSLIFLILPALYVTKISPAKAIRFN